MPRRDADALALQYRLALQAIRDGRAGRREAVAMAHVVLLRCSYPKTARVCSI
jgi:hypothetical protein